jgi:hypothetical protein
MGRVKKRLMGLTGGIGVDKLVPIILADALIDTSFLGV